MKVLLINGSPDPKGCISAAMDELAQTFAKNGIETKELQIGTQDIRGCIACRQCKKTGKCVFDDAVNAAVKDFEEADGIIVGSPVYYGSANATLVAFLTRLFFSTGHIDKRMKVGASIVSCRRAGNTATFDELNKFFTISEMPVASSRYWNEVHGYTWEDAKNDLEGMACMRTLANNMSFLIKSIALGKEQIGLPEKEAPVFTNFMR